GATDGGTSGSSGSSTSSAAMVAGCAVATIDAGMCTSYGSCVSQSVGGECNSSYGTCYAGGGPCATYLACTASCNCSDGACVSACDPSMSPACTSCLQTATMCSENACSAQLAQCLVGIN